MENPTEHRRAKEAERIAAQARRLREKVAKLKAGGVGVTKKGERRPKDNGRPPTHGLHAVKKKLKLRGFDAIDLDSPGGQQFKAFENALLDALGEDLSVQKQTLVNLAARDWMLLNHADAWLFSQESIVKGNSLLPVVSQRTQLASSLARTLGLLGLDEVKAREITLVEYLEKGDEAENSHYGSQNNS